MCRLTLQSTGLSKNQRVAEAQIFQLEDRRPHVPRAGPPLSLWGQTMVQQGEAALGTTASDEHARKSCRDPYELLIKFLARHIASYIKQGSTSQMKAKQSRTSGHHEKHPESDLLNEG